MKYHAKVEYSKNHYYWNFNKESIISKLLLPFINGQVILVTSNKKKKLLNLKSVSRITFYKTEESLKIKPGKSIIAQIQESDFEKNECTEELINETRLTLASPQLLSLLQKTLLKPENQAFVIMKFWDKKLDSAYEGVVKPVFEQKGIKVIRVDEIKNSWNISDQILELISTSKYIYADLTWSRPNCYYETWFAHALWKEIILSKYKTEKIHFDLSWYRFISWETESELRKELESRIDSLENIKSWNS